MNPALPLEGVRVIELCWVWSGPFLGQLLADLGAEVIKVEWWRRFDLYRTRGVERLTGKAPERLRREMSQSFHGLNRNKIGVTLDLKDEAHRAGLIELARKSDLVIENFTAGTIDRLGAGFDVLSKANPAIVLLSLSGFGAASRLADMRAYGLALSALGGVETQVVDPGSGAFMGSPTFVASDPNAACYGLLAAIAGVIEARRTGRGAHIELSQLEAAAHVSSDNEAELEALASGLGVGGLPSLRTRIVPTADGEYVAVCLPAQASEADFDRARASSATLPADLAIAVFEGLGANAVKAIEKPAEFGAGSAKAGTLIPTVHPITGPEQIVAAPWWVNGARPPLRKTAPTLGEGNAYVLGGLLGWPPQAYEALNDFERGGK